MFLPRYLKYSLIPIGLFIIFIFVAQAQWVEPTSDPPGNNVNPPVKQWETWASPFGIDVTGNGNNEIYVPTSTNAEIQLQSDSNPYWAIYNDFGTGNLRFWNQTYGDDVINITDTGKFQVLDDFEADVGYGVYRLQRGDPCTGDTCWYEITSMRMDQAWRVNFKLVGADRMSVLGNAQQIVHFYYNHWTSQAPTITHYIERPASVNTPGQIVVIEDGTNRRIFIRTGRYSDATLIVENFQRNNGEVGTIQTTLHPVQEGQGIPSDIAGFVIYDSFVDASAHTLELGSISAEGTICDTNGCIGGAVLAGGGWQEDGPNIVRLIQSSDSVGIGTITPSAKLHVYTPDYLTIKAEGNTDDGTGYVGSVIQIDSNNDARGRGISLTHRALDISDSQWYMGIPYTGNIFQIGNSNTTNINSAAGAAHKDQAKFVITEGGNVGIGTITPQEELEVSDNAGGGTAKIRIEDNDNNPELDMWFGPTSHWAMYVANDDDDSFRIWGNNTFLGANRFTILPNGNIGIGTDTPNEKLEVAGNALITGTLQIGDISGEPHGYILPNRDGLVVGQVLKTDTLGNLYWAADNSGGGGTGPLIDVLNAGSDASAFTGDTIIANSFGNWTFQYDTVYMGSDPNYGGYAYFGHNAIKANPGNYALLQNSNGTTYLNARTGQDLYFRINNATYGTLDSTGHWGIGLNNTNPTIDLAIGDSDTGFEGLGGGNLAVYSNGSEIVRFESGGDVGFGISNPRVPLHVKKSDRDVQLVLESSNATQYGAGIELRDVNPSGIPFIDFTQDDSGLNNNDPDYGGRIALWDDTSFRIYQKKNHNISFWTQDLERMTIGGNGYVGLGTDTPNRKLHIYQDSVHNAEIDIQSVPGLFNWWGIVHDSSSNDLRFWQGTNRVFFADNGDVTANGYFIASDERLKTDIKKLTGILDKILELNAVEYKWKDTEKGTDKQIGLIAQELEKEFPELVKINSDGYKSIDYSKLSVLLLAALQEQQADIQAIEARLDKLEQLLSE